VVDSEFGELIRVISQATDIQVVLRTHKTFVANLFRLSLIDNASIQEAFDRIIHVCLRFIALLRIMLDHAEERDIGGTGFHHRGDVATSDNHDSTKLSTAAAAEAKSSIYSMSLPLFVPPEEIQAIGKEFFSQVAYLFHLMRSIDCKGFMFRLDFNGFLSSSSLSSQLSSSGKS
jgi:hypothetical protein